ncbi:MAG TPA: hypothetical protein VFX11_06035 [Candidatus Kapabacteria bacterium]|nr:hypothetical protein [Candidatus Kapabacteria bacterium]
MGHVIVIFGTLIALNMGFGYWLSEQNAENQPQQGVVEVEDVQADASAPAAAPVEETKPAE